MLLSCKGRQSPTKQNTKKKHPKKVEALPGIFTRQAMVACAKVIVFFWVCFVVFFLVAPKHYKNSF